MCYFLRLSDQKQLFNKRFARERGAEVLAKAGIQSPFLRYNRGLFTDSSHQPLIKAVATPI